jgi:hypothetical protein
MNSSLMTADTTTHLKVLVVALCAALVVTAIGSNSRTSDPRNDKSDGAIIAIQKDAR